MVQTSISLLTSPAADLETSGPVSRQFFTCDTHDVVLEACRCHNIGFDEFAVRLGTNRTALLLMLRGIDPVPSRICDALRGFVTAARNGTRPYAAA
ncbi:MAG: hypothetical protein VW600_11745 [Ferrovibrio sp.]